MEEIGNSLATALAIFTTVFCFPPMPQFSSGSSLITVMYHHQRWWLDVNRSKRLSQVFFYSSGNKPRF